MTDDLVKRLSGSCYLAFEDGTNDYSAAQEAADRIEQLEWERDCAYSTLDAWFNRRKLAHEEIDQAVVDAASGYLRTARVGGMPKGKSDLILSVIQDMARLSIFADLFARASLVELEDGK